MCVVTGNQQHFTFVNNESEEDRPHYHSERSLGFAELVAWRRPIGPCPIVPLGLRGTARGGPNHLPQLKIRG
jgi:hypothetical protein